MLIISIIIPIVAFLFEIYPRLLNRRFGVDVWTHLLYLQEYHNQEGIPKKIGVEQGFIVEGEYDYPPMFIWILSRFPYIWVKKWEFLFSPFFDFIHNILIFFLAYAMTGSILVSFTTQLLYTLTPIIILENSSATPRSLGYLLFTISFYLLFIYQQGGSLLLLSLALISGSLIFLAHRFTTQSFLFFALFFSFLYTSFAFIGVFIVSFFIALVVSKGFYIKVLQGHIGNLQFWRKTIQYRFAHQVRGNESKQFKTQDFVFKMYNQFLKFPPFVLAITNPWTFPVFYLLLFSFPTDNIISYFILWVVFSYVLALITIWIPKLRFLGEGQRYLELSAFPAAFLSSYALFNAFDASMYYVALAGYVIVGIASFATILVIQKKAIINDKLRTLTPSMTAIFSHLKNLKKKPRLLCIPHQITTNTIYHTGCPVFVNADYKGMIKIKDVYPFLRKSVSRIMEDNKLDLLLLNTDYSSINDLKIKDCDIIYKSKNYILIGLT